MTTESVSPAAEPALEAFTAYDSSIFLGWMEAIGDMMLAGSKPENLGPSTLAGIGGLMYALASAAQELADRERRDLVAYHERQKVSREDERLDRVIQDAIAACKRKD